MTTEERDIEVSSITTKMASRNLNELVKIYYGWHPDSGEVVMSVKEGATQRDEFPLRLPEREWRTLDFEDLGLVDALFSDSTDLQFIEKLISEKERPASMALLQYIHWKIGQAL